MTVSTVLRTVRSALTARTTQWLLSLAFLVAAAVACGVALREQGDAVTTALTQLRLPAMLTALGLVLLSLLAAMAAWRVALAGMGSSLPVIDAGRIYFAGQLGTYLPGTGWQLVIHLHLARRRGVPSRHTVAAFIVAMAALTGTGLTAGLVAAPGMLAAHALWLLAPALFVVVVVARPELLRRLLGWLFRIARRPEAAAELSARHTRWSFALSMVSWCCNGLQLWVLAMALGAPPVASLPACVGGMALGILAGSFAPFAPGGVGPRELILVVTLSAFIPAPAAVVVAAASRLVHTVADAVAAGGFLLAGAAAVARPDRTIPVPPPLPEGASR